jgi:hypothetical protein
LLISTLIAGHDGDIPHLVSPRLVDGCQPGSRRRPLARRRAALPAAGLERPPPGAEPPRRRRGGLAGRPQLAAEPAERLISSPRSGQPTGLAAGSVQSSSLSRSC